MRMQPIVIREYVDADEHAVCQFILTIQNSEFDVPITLAEQPDLQNVRAFYQHGSGGFWVATTAERIVGTIALVDLGNAKVALRKMFVAKDYRGAALATALKLLDHALSYAAAQGARDVYLGTVDKFHAALRFYEKHGFAAIEKDALPAGFSRMGVDNRFYHRSL